MDQDAAWQPNLDEIQSDQRGRVGRIVNEPHQQMGCWTPAFASFIMARRRSGEKSIRGAGVTQLNNEGAHGPARYIDNFKKQETAT